MPICTLMEIFIIRLIALQPAFVEVGDGALAEMHLEDMSSMMDRRYPGFCRDSGEVKPFAVAATVVHEVLAEGQRWDIGAVGEDHVKAALAMVPTHMYDSYAAGYKDEVDILAADCCYNTRE